MPKLNFLRTSRSRKWLLFLSGGYFFLQSRSGASLTGNPDLHLGLLGLSGCLLLAGLGLWLFVERPGRSWVLLLRILYFAVSVAAVVAVLGATYRVQAAYGLR